MQALALASPASLEETRQTLLDSARRRFGAIPGETLVDHVLSVTGSSDFAVREAALDALQRRWGFAQRDGLMVASRPEGGRVLGAYATARPGDGRATNARTPKRGRRARAGEARPYRSVLEGFAPLEASCDCPDFVRSSLGVCKHLLVVLADVYASPKRLDAARRERREPVHAPRLALDPRLPLDGPLDRLIGLRLEEPPSPGPIRGRARATGLAPTLRRSFSGGAPEAAVLADPARRRELLASLHASIVESRHPLDATPAARALVVEELVRAERLFRNGAAAPAALAELRSLKRRLYPYQREGVERFLRAGRLLLADDMGLGKTTQAIAACHALFAAGRVTKGLIIAPASLKPQWLREWSETTHAPAAIVEGAPPERARQYRSLRSGFLILNYEQLLRDAEAITAMRPDMVVLDEAQRIKNYATKSAVYVKALSPEYRLILTGTPMENRLEELASVLDWVDDVALSPKWRLVPWYTAWEGDGGKGKAGARHLATLRKRLAPCVVRRVRTEVLEQLPSRTDTRVPVALTPQQAELHDELNQPIANLLRVGKKRPLTQPEFLKLMQLLTQQRIIANGLGQLRFEQLWPTYGRSRPDAPLLEGLFSPKLVELRRLLHDLVVAQGRKVVVFSQWRRMLRLADWSVSDVLGAEGLRAVFFTGAEKPSQRTRSIVDFHDDPRVRVMFLSDAGGVGLNLQKAASACVNLELPWNPAVLEQRIGRIYRLGQPLPIDVYNLVSEGSIEARIAGLVGAKQALFSGLFDGTSDEIRFDTGASFLSRVERLVDPGPLPAAPASAASTGGRGQDEAEGDMAAAQADAVLEDEAKDEAETQPASAETALPPRAAAPSGDVAALFRRLRVERTPDGGVRLEAPAEAAESLVALFQGMAGLLSSARPLDGGDAIAQ